MRELPFGWDLIEGELARRDKQITTRRIFVEPIYDRKRPADW
jgi:hypothetical protein